VNQRDPALDTAGRFGAFLDRTIREFGAKPVDLPKPDDFQPMHPEPVAAKPTPRPALNKFAELAAKLKANREEMHDEADKLSAETDAVMAEFRGGVAKHRSILADAKAGVQDLKEAAAIMSNFDPNDA
jgi:hypothetical protein